eukprot:9627256-Heterocapsa_arctica.AAC.1
MSSSLKSGSSSTSTTSSADGVDVADLSDGVGVVADLRGHVGPSGCPVVAVLPQQARRAW